MRLKLLLLAAFAASVLAACSEEGIPESPTLKQSATPEATETPIEPAILAAVEAYTDEQGWQLVGHCFGEQEQIDPAAESFCYMEPRMENGLITVSVSRVQSGEFYRLTLQQQASGNYRVSDVLHSADIPSSGPP